MPLRAFAAASLLLAPPPEPQVPLAFTQYPLVKRVDCAKGRGTAFRIGGTRWLSVAHVTAIPGCKIDGEPVSITEQNDPKDFARLDAGTSGNGFKINCGGFIPGRWYWAVGYPFGGPNQMAIAVYATYAKSPNGQRVLIGPMTFIKGMSGGPVIDPETREVVGTVNAYIPRTSISLSRDLRDTSVCGAGIA